MSLSFPSTCVSRVFLGTRVRVPQVVAEQRPPSMSAAGSGQAYDSAVSVGSVGLQVVEGLAVLAAVPAILTARECACCCPGVDR